MKCGCLERIDGELAKQGFRVSTKLFLFQVTDDLDLKMVMGLPLERLDGKRLQRKDPKTLQVSHCPFCGMKVRDDKLVEQGDETNVMLLPWEPLRNEEGHLCGLCDGTYAHEHPMLRCAICGETGLAENMPGHLAKAHPSSAAGLPEPGVEPKTAREGEPVEHLNYDPNAIRSSHP
jgi:hypothetical protein